MTDPFQIELIALLPRLRRFGLATCRDSSEADDLVQAAVEKALRSREQWQIGTRLDSWMFRIMQNLWIDQQRSRKLRAVIDDPEQLEQLPEETDWNRVIEAQMTLDRVLAVMRTLPDAMRAVLALVTIDGLSYQDAAQVLDVPIGTVMSRLSRARVELMKRLAERPTGVMT
ncbi:RNA polymerase sigma factor [Nevskia sp.]|uniref:RNA polymerase sigma factor n=1 Tax=Nevskia sp. TaxID=1929292 RepID=UPI0025D959A9|nr:RNA polymerase sigma factor [Nevskia sp.]